MRNEDLETRRNDLSEKLAALSDDIRSSLQSSRDGKTNLRITSRIEDMIATEHRLSNERQAIESAQQIRSLSEGKRSRISASKKLELSLTNDEIGSLRKYLKDSLAGGDPNTEAYQAFKHYDDLLAASKNGVVKISPSSYEMILNSWGKMEPKNSAIHSRTGRDILEFAALNVDGKYASPKRNGSKYSGFGPDRINNGASPEITKRMQKEILDEFGSAPPRRVRAMRSDGTTQDFDELNSDGLRSSRETGPERRDRRERETGLRTMESYPEDNVETAEDLADPDYRSPGDGTRGYFVLPARGPISKGPPVPALFSGYDEMLQIMGDDKIAAPRQWEIALNSHKLRTSSRQGFGYDYHPGEPLPSFSPDAAQLDAARASLRARDDDNYVPDLDEWRRANVAAIRIREGDPVARHTERLGNGMRSERTPDASRDGDNDVPEKKKRKPGAGRGFNNNNAPAGEGGKRLAEVIPSNWDDLPTEEKWDLLFSTLTPAKSGIAEKFWEGAVSRVGRKLEREESLKNRRETLAERRARRGDFDTLDESIARARKEQGDKFGERGKVRAAEAAERKKTPKRETAQSAAKNRTDILDAWDNLVSNWYNKARKSEGDDELGSEHMAFWEDLTDLLQESDDLTFSQIEAIEQTISNYLASVTPSNETEGDHMAKAQSLHEQAQDLLRKYRSNKFITQGDTSSPAAAQRARQEGSDALEGNDAISLGSGSGAIVEAPTGDGSLFSSDGMRSVRAKRDLFKTNAIEDYVATRMGMRSRRKPTKEDKVTDLRNAWHNAQMAQDQDEMRRVEALLEKLGASPVRRRGVDFGSSATGSRSSRGDDKRPGRTQVNGEATFFKEVKSSLAREIREAQKQNDNKTANALTLLERIMRRQASGKTGDKRTNAGSITVTQDEVDDILDGLMSVVDRQMDTEGSRLDMFVKLVEMFASAAMATFVGKTVDEITSRSQTRTDADGNLLRGPNGKVIKLPNN
jgi:hypothetical protein